MANQDKAKDYLQSGETFFQQENYIEADKEFEKSLALNPEDPEAYNGLGRVALVQARHADAEGFFRKASELAPAEPVYHSNLGLVLQRLTRYADAEAEFERTVALNPNDPEAYNGLGRVALVQARHADAEGFFRKASELAPAEPVYHSNLGLVLQRLTRYADAEAEFERTVALNPNDPEAYNGLGRVALVRQRYEEAELAFRKAITLDEKGYAARLYLGSLLTSLERYDEAEACLKEALKLDPTNSEAHEAHNEFGRCFFRQRKYNEAASHYRQAVRLKPNNLAAQRGSALSLMEVERFDEAERQLRALVEPKAQAGLDKQDIRVIHETLADLFMRLGDKRGDEIYYDEAVKSVDKALSLAPDGQDANLRFKRGIIQCYRKQYEVAEKDFERCVKLDKNHWAAQRNLERLQSSLAGRRSKNLEKMGVFLAGLAIVQLVGLWLLYTKGLPSNKPLGETVFGILAPLFFAFTLVSILLPQLTKFKVGGLEADLEKAKLEPSKGLQGIGLETSWNLTPLSNITPEPGREDMRGAVPIRI
jgi:Flp pilus assembly protein TadD